MAVAALLVVLVALLAGASSDEKGAPPVPVGPGGAPVTDSFYFVHRPLAGDGSITVSVTALDSSVPQGLGALRPGDVPWAKAGLIVKEGTGTGAPYAAIMVTGGHGVRMQDDYVDDTAGLPGTVSASSVRWLRLDRSGDTITGYASTDGTNWARVGTARLRGLGSTAQVGLFVASPQAVAGLGTTSSVSTAAFGFITTEYRRRLINVTLAASPGRGRVLLAKAIVLGCVSFVVGLAGTAVALQLGQRLARANGVYLFPVTSATELRVALGTAALLAAAAAATRPGSASPASCLPLSPWAGSGVTAGWAAAALTAGGLLLCLRDA